MSILKDVWQVVKDISSFVAGDKKQPKLEEPLGELKTEKTKQDMADRRRNRANRNHGDQR